MAIDLTSPVYTIQARWTGDMLQKDAKFLNARWGCIRPKGLVGAQPGGASVQVRHRRARIKLRSSRPRFCGGGLQRVSEGQSLGPPAGSPRRKRRADGGRGQKSR